MVKIKIFLIVILILIIAYFLFNKYFKEKSIFDEIKLPEPLYEP